MKRLHVHVRVEDLARSIGFYSTLFGVEPTVRKPDYAKWMLDDPRVNFAVSATGKTTGIDHLGIQVEDTAELAGVAERLSQAGERVVAQTGAYCCYARSDKGWVADPEGVLWEIFYSHGEVTRYGDDHAPDAAVGGPDCGASEAAATALAAPAAAGSCCAPKPAAAKMGSCCA